MTDGIETAPGGARPRLLFYVQHLLGMGHLVRAARVAKALAATDFAVTLAMGGQAPPGLDIGRATLVALPPVKAGAGFSALVHPDGRAFGAADQAARAALLLALFDRLDPAVVITEAFPFGRRQMRFELLPLLERARSRATPPLIVASVRDILQRDRRPDRAAETVAAVDRFFDLVLVHGDRRLVAFDDSFPSVAAFADKVAYTGLVAPEPRPAAVKAGAERFAAVVSAGGGAVGWPILDAALKARPLTRLADQPWLLLTGPNLPSELQAQLSDSAPPGVAVRAFVPDLAELLARADVSISQAGYNTVGDLLVAGCRALLVPFAQGGETEQGERATRLAALGLAVATDEAGLTPAGLAAAVNQALDLPRASHGLDLDGAARTAEIVAAALAARP